MFFKSKKVKGDVQQKQSNNVNIVSNKGMQFGESIIEENIIKNESMKMVEKYSELIDQRIKNADKNECHFAVTYAVSRAGIMYIHDPDGGSINVAYRDYNIAALEEDYKKEGVAWALQKIIVPQLLQKYPMITKHYISSNATDLNKSYGWMKVTLSFEIYLNRFRSL